MNTASENCQNALQLIAAAGRHLHKRRSSGVGGGAPWRAEELTWNTLEDSQNCTTVSLGTGLVLPERTESKDEGKSLANYCARRISQAGTSQTQEMGLSKDGWGLCFTQAPVWTIAHIPSEYTPTHNFLEQKLSVEDCFSPCSLSWRAE